MFSTFTTFHATKKQRKKIASNAQKSALTLQENLMVLQKNVG
jgi:hypothetical protein